MARPSSTDLPRLTLVVPVRNEAATIDACLASLLAQTYPYDRLEILVVDGASTDDTAQRVRRWIEREPRVHLLANPAQIMALGLNHGIEAATGSIIGVISGHSTVEPDYAELTVKALKATGAWAVGGRIERAGENPVQRAIAIATSSPMGIGNARHNYASRPEWVDAVFPGTWPRRVFDEVGLFDPRMTANEDNEFSYRIRKAGGRIWFDPSIAVWYVPRASLAALFSQYRRYAYGRVLVFAKHRGGVSWRHLVPPTWLAWLVAGGVGALVTVPTRLLWVASLGAYLVAILASGAWLARRGGSPLLISAALITLHTAYGIGVWAGLAAWLMQGRSFLSSR